MPDDARRGTSSPTSRERGVRIGVDVGSVRVGVAASDPDGLLATPVATLARHPGSAPGPEDGDIVAIADLVRERSAVGVVVGLPRSLSGGEGPLRRWRADMLPSWRRASRRCGFVSSTSGSPVSTLTARSVTAASQHGDSGRWSTRPPRC